MRILLVHKFYSIVGGAEVFYHEVGRVLREHGHEVAMFSCSEDDIDYEWSGYFPPKTELRDGGLFQKILDFPSTVYSIKAKDAMARMIREFKPDLVHAFSVYVQLTPSVLVAAREAGVPVLLSCNDYKHLCPNYKLYHHGHVCEECKGGRFYRAIVNKCCHNSTSFSMASTIEAYIHSCLDVWRRNVDVFLFASDFMAKKTDEFWGKGAIRYDMLRNPFSAEKNRLEGKVGDYILYFGRLIDEKGVDLLLEAAGLCPELPIVIIGDGPDFGKLQKLAESLPNVRLLGPKWGDELNAYLKDCRFVVVPSLWHENFPYVIFQAFAAGKPVIGSNRGGIPELVRESFTGWIFDVEDVQSLAHTLRKAFGNSDEAIRVMGNNAYDYIASEFSDDAFYATLLRIYNNVLSKSVASKLSNVLP